MVGMRLLPEDSDVAPARTLAATDLTSDDDRSVAADSWSIKSEYGSTLDDEQRHADATEALAAVNNRAPSDYSSDKEEQDAEGVSSMLGFQSYWDSAYADELANYREHGHAGEVWFGADVMEIVASWTRGLCTGICQNHLSNHVGDGEQVGVHEKDLADWSVLDIGTGNGLLLQEFAKQGSFSANYLAQSLQNLESSIMLRWKFAVCVIVKIVSVKVTVVYEKHMAFEKK
ncbi:uncharacterized protein LOC125810339 [Solanum verrucosum]|uniref:uncharacterized protein LOC125810339 n=1 Tax=Solanum verrucosum TaxID=315347 RepID=UPI0020D1C592|nr:uncharacterized protein LOC125810339 [Solanum verrucosum]